MEWQSLEESQMATCWLRLPSRLTAAALRVVHGTSAQSRQDKNREEEHACRRIFHLLSTAQPLYVFGIPLDFNFFVEHSEGSRATCSLQTFHQRIGGTSLFNIAVNSLM